MSDPAHNSDPSLRVLIIATDHGACRSPMLAGWLDRFAGERIVTRIGSVAPTGADPLAVEVMREIGIDVAHRHADPLVTWLDQRWDWAVLMRNPKEHRKPNLTATGRILYREFPDPAKATGTDDAIMGTYRSVRDDIHDWARSFVEHTIGLAILDRKARQAASRINNPS